MDDEKSTAVDESPSEGEREQQTQTEKKKTPKHKNKKILYFGGIALLLVVIVIAILSLGGSFVSKEQLVLNYLKQKYGDGNWVITSSEPVTYMTRDGFVERTHDGGNKYTVTSSYIDNKSFHIRLGKSNIIEDDFFLPTYYSVEYNLDYEFGTDHFDDLIDRMVFVTEYHYPYKDWVFSFSWRCDHDGPKCRIGSYEMGGVFDAISVTYSPNPSKDPDIIPDIQRVPELEEMIGIIEQYYSSDRLKNKEINDGDFYDLVFNNKATEEEIIDYIKGHTPPVEGVETTYEYLHK